MGPGEFLSIDFFTALFTLVNTVALFLVLKKYLFKPVMKMITDRQAEIDQMYDAAGNAKEEAEAMRQEYAQKLEQAQQTGERIVKEAVERGQSREEEIIRNANLEANAMMEKASAAIAQEKKKAINDAKDEISELALAIAGKVVGRELRQEDHAAYINSFIDQLGESV